MIFVINLVMRTNVKLIAIIAVSVVIVAGGAVVLSQNSSNERVVDTVTVTQVDGSEKTVKYLPERVVCLSTYTCEVLMFMKCTDKVVGVTNSTKTNPDQKSYYENSVDVGNFNNPDMATIVSLNPDLVITWSSQPDVAKSLEQSGIQYVFLQCSSYETVCSEITSVGKIFGKEGDAEKFSGFYDRIFGGVKALVDSHDTKKRVYMESFSKNYAAGKSSAYYALAVFAGADMVYRESVSGTIDPAWTVSQNPDVIIKTPMLKSMAGDKAKKIYDEICSREGFSSIVAVANKDVYILCSQLFSGPRCFAGLVACYDIFYGGDEYSLNSVLEDYNKTFGLNLPTEGLSYSES